MKQTARFIMILVPVSLFALWGAGCTEEKLIEIALNTEYPADFVQGPSANVDFENEETVNIGEDVDTALEGTKFNRSDIVGAYFNGASYGVTEFLHSHDWVIGGSVLVQRLDPVAGPEVELIAYESESVQDALGKKFVATLTPAGVAVINQALADFVAGDNPELRFVTRNEAVTPAPGLSDRISFTWRVWVQYQIVVSETADIFDPL
jgi:hypothetical protein